MRNQKNMIAIALDMPISLLSQLDMLVNELGERRNPMIRHAIREFLQRSDERHKQTENDLALRNLLINNGDSLTQRLDAEV